LLGRHLTVMAGHLQGGLGILHQAAQSRRGLLMHGPHQDNLHPKRDTSQGAPLPQGLPVPEPHNDVAPTPSQPEPPAPKKALWPLLVIILGLILTVLWIGVLGWLAFRLMAGLLS